MLNILLKKKYDDKKVECNFCGYKGKPIIRLNRTKSDLYGGRFTGKDKAYWLICSKCKKIIGTK